ncbi:MAG: DNA repair protein RecO [Chloroflexales bacterium]|nr:DNA repair protein RecO [Chloroflexales bacterium]
MAERLYRTESIVLRRSDFSESDRLILLATPLGKRRVVAKGVRKTMSRLAGHVELFTHNTMLLALGRNLDIITQSQTIHGFSSLRSDLARISCAYYVADVYDQFTQEEEENRPLFELLVQVFDGLNTRNNTDLALRWYELHILHQTGYRPQLHYCAVCQEALTEEANRFSPTIGGVLCPRDAQADRTALPMGNACFRLLRYLQSQPLEIVDTMTISATVRAEAERLLRTYVRYIIERDLKSVTFLNSLRT